MQLTEAEITQLLLDGEAPSNMLEVPEGINTVTLYAQEKSGAWLPALSVRVNLDDISSENWRRPLRLAVRGDKRQLPE